MHIPENEVAEYEEIMKEAREQYSIPPAPAMPVISQYGAVGKPPHAAILSGSQRPHEESQETAGVASHRYFALVHSPVNITEAMKIPAAVEALDAEWNKLQDKVKAWDLSSVMEREDVIKSCKKRGRTPHFGTLMTLCHEKHSELNTSLSSRSDEVTLAKYEKKYKGRVVLRGDTVRDDTGHFAVFSEQGTSASLLAAAKFIDAIARFPGNDGSDSDAIGAYTQVPLKELEDTEGIETWISLPKNRRPASWAKFKDPVCHLKKNLYGHTLAGLLWEKFCHRIIKKLGFQPVPGWECLFVHKEKQLFLSVYVDDFKMAGNKHQLSAMWKALGKEIDLELPVSFSENIYLGVKQKDVDLPKDHLEKRKEFVQTVLSTAESLADSTEYTKRGEESVSNSSSNRAMRQLSQSRASPHIRAWQYSMEGHAEQCVERYLDLAEKDINILKTVWHPGAGGGE